MPRKSVALFLASTTLLSSLAGCSPQREGGGEKGGEKVGPGASGQPVQPNIQPTDGKGKGLEGGEGGEGGEG